MKQKTYIDVSNYCLVKNQTFIANKERIIKDLFSEKIFDEHKFDGASLMSLENKLIVPISPKKTFVYDIESERYYIIRYSCLYLQFGENKIILTKRVEDSSGYQLMLYDLESETILLSPKTIFSLWNEVYIGGTFLIPIDGTRLSKFDMSTETTLWEFDSSELGIEKVGKIMGVFGEVLVLVGTVNDESDSYFPKKDLIFGLAISTGKVLWKTQTAENYEVNTINGLHYGLKTYRDERIMRGLGGNHYFELDTQNGIIQAFPLQEQLTHLGLHYLQSSDISSTHLYFKSSSNQGHGLDNCIGSFDYKTKKIDWHHVMEELSETSTTIKNGEPKASVNKVYALDNNNTLHIFERE